MKIIHTGVVIGLITVLLTAIAPAAPAEVEDHGVKKRGVVHNIASDRKVERVGGIYEPEGIDKYMKRKFEDVMNRLDAIEQKIDRVDSRLNEFISAEKQKPDQGTLVSAR